MGRMENSGSAAGVWAAGARVHPARAHTNTKVASRPRKPSSGAEVYAPAAGSATRRVRGPAGPLGPPRPAGQRTMRPNRIPTSWWFAVGGIPSELERGKPVQVRHGRATVTGERAREMPLGSLERNTTTRGDWEGSGERRFAERL